MADRIPEDSEAARSAVGDPEWEASAAAEDPDREASAAAAVVAKDTHSAAKHLEMQPGAGAKRAAPGRILHLKEPDFNPH